MRAADRTLARLAAELSPGQREALAKLDALKGRVLRPPEAREGSVVVGIFLALGGLVRRGEAYINAAIAEAQTWVDIFEDDSEVSR